MMSGTFDKMPPVVTMKQGYCPAGVRAPVEGIPVTWLIENPLIPFDAASAEYMNFPEGSTETESCGLSRAGVVAMPVSMPVSLLIMYVEIVLSPELDT